MDYLKRVKRLHAVIKDSQLDLLIVDDLTNILYLTGLELSAGQIVLTPTEAFLIVDNRYYEKCCKQSPIPVKLLKDTPLKDFLKDHLGASRTIGFDAETTSYKSYQDYQKIADEIGSVQLKALPNVVRELRAIKDSDEQILLAQAATLGSKGFEYVRSLLKEGITEIQLATELEIFWKRQGGKKLAFDPIIAFGPNSSMPHHRASDRALKMDEVVLIDIGVNLDHYHSDMTRVVFFGRPLPELEKVYQIVKEAKEAALKICRPGVLIGDLDAAARKVISDKGYGPLFTHRLGHGVGLEIHELPNVHGVGPYKDVPLQPGMTITIEPGIYLPDVGGVRLEDTIIITENGYKNLTQVPC
jgi:Xaa-Pro aminopeptidase